MWGQIGPTVKNDSHSVTYRRIRQTVSPPLDSPKMLMRDVLKIVFFFAKVASLLVSGLKAKGCDGIALERIKSHGFLQPNNCAYQSDLFVLSR